MNEETAKHETTEEINLNKAISKLVSLFGKSNKMFGMGILFVSILQIIPILPTRNRTTGNILNRLFASMLFAPLSLVLMVLFPLYFNPDFAQRISDMSDKIIKWYEYEDLNPYGL